MTILEAQMILNAPDFYSNKQKEEAINVLCPIDLEQLKNEMEKYQKNYISKICINKDGTKCKLFNGYCPFLYDEYCPIFKEVLEK